MAIFANVSANALFGKMLQIQSEAAALTALFNQADGENWRRNTNWRSDKPLNEWQCVETVAEGKEAGRVKEVILYNNRLRGTIPSELLDSLPALTKLSISGNLRFETQVQAVRILVEFLLLNCSNPFFFLFDFCGIDDCLQIAMRNSSKS
jgi:hypothetical protein